MLEDWPFLRVNKIDQAIAEPVVEYDGDILLGDFGVLRSHC